MKKFLFLLLIFAVTAGAFAPQAAAQSSLGAQFRWRLYADLCSKLVMWNTPTGEKADKFITVGNNKVINTSGNNPTASAGSNTGIAGTTRGDYTYTAGTLDFFNASNAVNTIPQSSLNLHLDYKNRYVMFHVNVPLGTMFHAIGAATDRNRSFVQGSGSTANWTDFLRFSFVQWYARGNAGLFTGYVGNTPDTGKVRQFGLFPVTLWPT